MTARGTSADAGGTSADAGLTGFGRSVALTTVTNVTATAAAGLAGIVVARALGPTMRGEYAAVVAWFGLALVIGELGQPAATTYFVARDPPRAAGYLATSRHMMVLSGSVTLIVGILVAPLLAGGDETVAYAYRLVFVTCLVSFVAASYTFSLQAAHTSSWNLVRVCQPLAFGTAVAILYVTGALALMTVLAVLAGTIVVQGLLAMYLCYRQGLTGGRRDPDLARPMTRYGLGQLASSVPGVLTARLDQLVLSIAVAPAALGHYAVAASLTALAVPVVSAFGSVAFPRLAARVLSPTATAVMQRRAIVASGGVGVALMVPLACAAPWFVPAVFGSGYQDSVPLVALLAPAGVFLACGQVCGDLLRGYGQPIAVARAQTAAATLTVVLLATLVPLLGVAGAALSTSASAGLALVMMVRRLRGLAAVPDAAMPTTVGGETPTRRSTVGGETPTRRSTIGGETPTRRSTVDGGTPTRRRARRGTGVGPTRAGRSD